MKNAVLMWYWAHVLRTNSSKKIPVTIAGMSFGALSANAKESLGRGASMVGTSTTTGDGGMTPEERITRDLGLSIPTISLWHEPR